jgi:uncharacterized protein (TIGR02421 family)
MVSELGNDFDIADLIDEVTEFLLIGKAIRRELPGGGRLHIDRPLPFMFLHIAKDGAEPVARDIAVANASYLIAPDAALTQSIITAVSDILTASFGGFLIFDVGELEQDRFLKADAPFLSPFEIAISASSNIAETVQIFTKAVSESEVRFRSPLIVQKDHSLADAAMSLRTQSSPSQFTIRFAPIYCQAETATIYPELRDRLVSLIVDSGLRAIAQFAKDHTTLKLKSHRALGRKAFVDAVSRVDRSIDEVASSFDMLLAVTPINAAAAYNEFMNHGSHPHFLYRPLEFHVEAIKKKLYSISFDHLEDPVLYHLYREKQRELDLQLSLIASRHTAQYSEFGRALYGPVEPSLLQEANDILAGTATGETRTDSDASVADCFDVEHRARAMIAKYMNQINDFNVTVELRDDLPSGLMVSGNRLLIARSTKMDSRCIEPILTHEIGVHLLTYFNGRSQGLRLFRNGLAGYEAMQEGLAVFAEYLAGGMTMARLRLIAARVVGCDAMLRGEDFSSTYSLLVDKHHFASELAFNIALRLYRGGGLAKDAIYLRGLLLLLSHLQADGALEPFWMGKISASHFGVMEELAERGLLHLPRLRPLCLETDIGKARLNLAKRGMRPLDLLQH